MAFDQASVSGSQVLRGTAMLIIWGGVDDSRTNEEELNDWWTNEHLPERLAIEGFLRTRRFYAEKDSKSQYLVWYEVASLDTLTSPGYMLALNNPTERTSRFMPVLASMNRSACNVLYSASRREFDKCREGGIGGTLAHIVLHPPSEPARREQLRKTISERIWPDLVTYPGSLAIHLIEHDNQASQSGSSTKSYDGVRFQSQSTATHPRWILLIEFAEPIAAPFAKHRALGEEVLKQLDSNEADVAEFQFYSLICAVAE